MNKLIILTTLFLAGCVSNKTMPINTPNKTEVEGFYQAYDRNWEDDPSINPVFTTKGEAEEYARRNNMNELQDGHSYIVRAVNYRYEVRQVNDAVNELLYTSLDYNDAYEYVVEYSSSHSDLIIYDLKTGERFEETP